MSWRFGRNASLLRKSLFVVDDLRIGTELDLGAAHSNCALLQFHWNQLEHGIALGGLRGSRDLNPIASVFRAVFNRPNLLILKI